MWFNNKYYFYFIGMYRISIDLIKNYDLYFERIAKANNV